MENKIKQPISPNLEPYICFINIVKKYIRRYEAIKTGVLLKVKGDY